MSARRTALALSVSVAVPVALLTPEVAYAQQGPRSHLSGGDWRRTKRPKDDAAFTESNWRFSLRGGPYVPRVDEEFGGDGPYAKVFGDAPRVFLGIEIDWKLLRIPYVGWVGPGIGWGYTTMSALAKITGTGEDSGSKTSLWIMPMHASAVLEIDAVARHTVVPLVLYGKGGIGYGLWSAGSAGETPEIDGVKGEGWSAGLHVAGGAMFGLSWIDPEGQSQLRTGGVYEAYVLAEWMHSDLGTLGADQMRVGTSTWLLGVGVDF